MKAAGPLPFADKIEDEVVSQFATRFGLGQTTEFPGRVEESSGVTGKKNLKAALRKQTLQTTHRKGLDLGMEKGIGQPGSKGGINPRLPQTASQSGFRRKRVTQTLEPCYIPYPQTPQGPPRRLNTPSRRVTIQHNPQNSARRQTCGQGLETGQGISQMMQHPIGIDQTEGAWGNGLIIQVAGLQGHVQVTMQQAMEPGPPQTGAGKIKGRDPAFRIGYSKGIRGKAATTGNQNPSIFQGQQTAIGVAPERIEIQGIGIRPPHRGQKRIPGIGMGFVMAAHRLSLKSGILSR